MAETAEKVIFGHPLSWWLKKYPLPVHLYSAQIIEDNLAAFQKVFRRHYPKSRVCFAAKACTHVPILKIANKLGCGADVASYNEVRVALDAGMRPEMLDLNGNCKEDFLIEQAIQKNMNIIADSIEELDDIQAVAQKLSKRPRVLLRISGYQLEAVTDDSVFTAGLWTKFGTQLKHIPAFLSRLDEYPNIELIGFHTHIGSQISKLEPYLSVMAKLIEMGQLLNASGGRCQVINIGGGFPISYVDKSTWETIVKKIKDGFLRSQKGDNSKIFVWHDGLAGFSSEGDQRIHLDRWTGERFNTEYPKEKMLEALLTGSVLINGKKMNTVDALKSIGEPMLTIEPGRSVVEDAGVTIARVGIVKTVADDHNLVNLEMGITSQGEALIEKPVKRWEIVNDYQRSDPEPFEAFIGGNLCFSGDMISKYKVFLQRKPVRGDLVMIHDTGAYTSSLFAANSNSFPRPERVLVSANGKTQTLKRRDKYEDIIK